MFGGEREFIALLGQLRQLLMRAEIIRRDFERLLPTCDPFRQRPVDILERLFGGGVARSCESGRRCAAR